MIAEAESIMSEVHPDGYRFAAKAFAETDERDLLPRIAVPALQARSRPKDLTVDAA